MAICPQWTGFENKARFLRARKKLFEFQKELFYIFPDSDQEKDLLKFSQEHCQLLLDAYMAALGRLAH